MNYSLDIELDNEILNYGIYDTNSILKKRIIAERTIRDKISGILPKKCAIWGAGTSTEQLINNLHNEDRSKIKYIIDKNKKKPVFNKYAVFLPEELDNFAIPIIVASYRYRFDIISDIRRLNEDIKIIDLYAFFEEEGITLEKDYFDYNITYESIHMDEIAYREKKSEYWIKKIISDYVFIRDFRNAFLVIEENKQILGDNYVEFENKVKRIVRKTKNNINGKHIVMFWVDSLMYEESKTLPFLADCEKAGYVFENAYSNGIHTRTAFKTLLSGELLFENDNIIKSYTDLMNESLLIEELKKRGYGCSIITNYSKELAHEDYVNDYPAGAFLMWKGLGKLLDSSIPMFLIIHIKAECHCPYYAPGLSKMLPARWNDTEYYALFGEDEDLRNSFIKQMKDATLYIDSQLRWYSDIYSNTMYRIYMSDHGKNLGEALPNFVRQSHSFLIINGDNITHTLEYQIIEMRNYYKLISILIDNNLKEISNILSQYAIVLEDDLYSKPYIDDLIRLNAERFIRSMMQFRGVITLEDAYVKYATGEDYYFVRNGNKYESNENINDEERIQYLEGKIEVDFINSYKLDSMRYCKKAYEYLGIDPVFSE